MFEKPSADHRRIVKRTVTITTVETWMITIGPEHATVAPEPDGASDTVSTPISDPDESNHWEDI
jgi:hypothetical protein